MSHLHGFLSARRVLGRILACGAFLGSARSAHAAPPAPAMPATPAATPAAPAAPATEGPAVAIPPADSRERNDRELRGHTFLFPVLQESIPFATTHFGVRQGFLFTGAPKVPLGPAGKVDIDSSGLIQSFDLGVRIAEWISVQLRGSGTVTTGVNVASIFLTGATYGANFEGGPIIRVLRVESTGTQVAVQATGGYGFGRAISVLPLVQALSAQPTPDLKSILSGTIGNTLLAPQSNFGFSGAVMGAQTLTPNFGLLARLEGRYAHQTISPYDANEHTNVDEVSKEVDVTAAIAASADGSPNGVPLGVVLEYLATYSNHRDPDDDTTNAVAHVIGASFYYTGRKNLQVGFGGAMQLGLDPIAGVDVNGAPAKSGSPSVYYGQFILRYVW